MRGTARPVAVCLVVASALAGGASGGFCQARAAGGQPSATITYVGNSGFLIRAGGKSILIDALFDGFPGRYAVPAAVRDPLLAGSPPYDGIDLILATHDHADHFGAAAVQAALRANPGAVFVGPTAATASLSGVGGRVRGLEVPDGERRTLEVNGVSVTAMPLLHGRPPAGRPGIVNLAYLITVGGLKFFHTGDVSVENVPISVLHSLGVRDERVDVAFVPHFLLSTPARLRWVTEGIGARTVVASHYQYTEPPDTARIRRAVPSAVVFRTEGESRVVR